MPSPTVALVDSRMYHIRLWQTQTQTQTQIFTFSSKCRGEPATTYMTSNVVSGSYSLLPTSSSTTSSPTDKKPFSTPKGLSKKFSFSRSFSGTTFLSSSRCISSCSPEQYHSHPMFPSAEQTKELALHDPRCAEDCKSTCPYFIHRHFTYFHAERSQHPVSAKELLFTFYATSDDYTQAQKRLCILKTQLQRAELECAWASRRCTTNPSRLMIPPHRFKERDNAEAKRLHAQKLYEEAHAARLERALELLEIGRF